MGKAPIVTMVLLCYHQEDYIEESVTSLLRQDYPNLKIVISDDNSNDKTFDIVQSIVSKYQEKNIVTNKNKKNLGIGRHFSYVMDNFIEGELVIACGGDDISAGNRVSRIVEEWIKNDKPALVAHSLEEIDENGNTFVGNRTVQYKYQDHSIHKSQLLALKDYLENQTPVRYLGAAIAYRLDAYTKFGYPAARPDYEDHLMYFRALLTEGVHYFPEVLIKYRRHQGSFMSGREKRKIVYSDKMYSIFTGGDNKLKDKLIDAYRIHQVTTQQWFDYSKAMNNGLFIIDYQTINLIWANLLVRHKRLLGNRWWYNFISIPLIRAYTQARPRRYEAKIYNMTYVKPLKAVLYGAGASGRNTLTRIGPGFEIVAFCDSNPKLHRKKIKGLLINSPQEMKQNINEIDCILIASIYFYEIKKFLVEEIDIPENKIVRLPRSLISD